MDGLDEGISAFGGTFSCSDSLLGLGVLDVREGTDGISNLTLGDSLSEDLLHLVLLFLLLLFRFGSYFPLFDVLSSDLQLKVVDIWANISKLEEDWHNDKLDEASLSPCDVGGGTIAHHGDI